LVTADNYFEKALLNLQKAAEILEYSKMLNQTPSGELATQTAAVVKLLSAHLKDISVSDEDVQAQDKMVKDDIAFLATIFKHDNEYPTI
jgi:hypothetical protein